MRFARARDIPLTLLGRGCDLVISDAGVRGLVVRGPGAGEPRRRDAAASPTPGCRWRGPRPLARARRPVRPRVRAGDPGHGRRRGLGQRRRARLRRARPSSEAASVLRRRRHARRSTAARPRAWATATSRLKHGPPGPRRRWSPRPPSASRPADPARHRRAARRDPPLAAGAPAARHAVAPAAYFRNPREGPRPGALIDAAGPEGPPHRRGRRQREARQLHRQRPAAARPADVRRLGEPSGESRAGDVASSCVRGRVRGRLAEPGDAVTSGRAGATASAAREPVASSVLLGGPSAEHDVSLVSGRAIAAALAGRGHAVERVAHRPRRAAGGACRSSADGAARPGSGLRRARRPRRGGAVRRRGRPRPAGRRDPPPGGLHRPPRPVRRGRHRPGAVRGGRPGLHRLGRGGVGARHGQGVFKRLVRGLGLPVVAWREVERRALDRADRAGVAGASSRRSPATLTDPRLMVKPDRLGLGVGMTIVHARTSRRSWRPRSRRRFRFDDLVLAERVPGRRPRARGGASSATSLADLGRLRAGRGRPRPRVLRLPAKYTPGRVRARPPARSSTSGSGRRSASWPRLPTWRSARGLRAGRLPARRRTGLPVGDQHHPRLHADQPLPPGAAAAGGCDFAAVCRAHRGPGDRPGRPAGPGRLTRGRPAAMTPAGGVVSGLPRPRRRHARGAPAAAGTGVGGPPRPPSASAPRSSWWRRWWPSSASPRAVAFSLVGRRAGARRSALHRRRRGAPCARPRRHGRVNLLTLPTASLEAALRALPAVTRPAPTARRSRWRCPTDLVVTLQERQPIVIVAGGRHALPRRRRRAPSSRACPRARPIRACPWSDDQRTALGRPGRRRALDPSDLAAARQLAALTPAFLRSAAGSLALAVTDDEGWTLDAGPDLWHAVFGVYTVTLRPPTIIPCQAQCLASLLAAGGPSLREQSFDVIRLAPTDARCGTYTVTDGPSGRVRHRRRRSPEHDRRAARSPARLNARR